MRRLLVIDDQDLITSLLKKALTRFGYQVTIASRPYEGMCLYDKGAFDLVITDMIMPDMDGGKIVGHIRQSSRPNTPVIGMSGTPWLFKHNGFDFVLAKPFSLQDLLRAIQCLLSERPPTRQQPCSARGLNA